MPTCAFCPNDPHDMTPGGDWVCKPCGDAILEAHYASRED